MKVQTINDIRTTFLEYFKEKGHLVMSGASLLPANDPTLLFTTAGMVPFKDYFSGAAKPPRNRIATVQKCIRTTDLESVGRTKRHLSMFEMLGNFSFGDYFKKEAIEFAWEYTTSFLPFPKENIWISIFEKDDEAFDLWTKHIGIPAKRVVRLGRADNFWGPAGETGACGPCSELYLDRGVEFGPEETAPGGSGDRFMEFWNLVFNQYNYNGKEYLPLQQTGIDTGAGLERLATLVQGVDSVYDTDELKTLRDAIARHYNASYEGENILPIRVLTDHVRALSFAMADGIYPANESRGYVLRRILRRALLFGRRLGQKESKLFEMVDVVTAIYGKFYPELMPAQYLTKEYIKQEENRFLKTLESGADRLEEILHKAEDGAYGERTIPGKEIFILYDTYGFPPEMTKELAEARNLKLDMQGFHKEMENQRARGRAAWKGAAIQFPQVGIQTEFTGYDRLQESAEVTALIIGDQQYQKIKELELTPNSVFYIITRRTCFYPESGGQLGDTGLIEWNGGRAAVIDTQKNGDAIVHICAHLEGSLSVGDTITLTVDRERRNALARHHSATHLLNGALRRVLGEHVRQSGSLVHEDYLRFDFTHPAALNLEQITAIEEDVNNAIAASVSVQTAVLPKEEAEKRGALMTFGEKYGDIVRVVEIGSFSSEFCGGTHVGNTNDIGMFFLAKESSPGAGNRRIEAYAGAAASKMFEERRQEIASMIKVLEETASVSPFKERLMQEIYTFNNTVMPTPGNFRSLSALRDRLKNIEADMKRSEKKAETKRGFAPELPDRVLKTKRNLGALTIAAYYENDLDIAALKSLADRLREMDPAVLFLLGGYSTGMWSFVAACSRKYADDYKIDLSETLKKILPGSGANGGGKKELVQAVCKNVKDSQESLNNFIKLFEAIS